MLCKNSPILFSVAVSIERKRIDNFTKYSQIISTHLLTVLTKSAITYPERRKRNKEEAKRKG